MKIILNQKKNENCITLKKKYKNQLTPILFIIFVIRLVKT